MKRLALAALSLLLAAPLGGCGASVHARDVVRTRVAKEQRCDEKQVQVEELGGNAYRSSGCGPETTYVCNYPELPERSRQYFTCGRRGGQPGGHPARLAPVVGREQGQLHRPGTGTRRAGTRPRAIAAPDVSITSRLDIRMCP